MLRPPAGPLISLLAIHTFAPRGSGVPTIWSRGLQEILVARVAADAKPLIVVGNFNATDDMRQFQALLDHHLSDAAVELGQGWRTTWPRNVQFMAPFLRPDHLLYSDGLTATSYRLGQGSGSDRNDAAAPDPAFRLSS
jgi:endonuclease/exonuclease/phosphatase (EEP) superfamily protein YafD